MNRPETKRQWTQLKGHAREKWGEPTDDDLDRIAGRRQALVGMIQARYGRDVVSAEREVSEWLDAIGNGR